MMKEKWLGGEHSLSVVKYVSDFKDRLMRAREIALENLRHRKMMRWCDRKVKMRTFCVGDTVGVAPDTQPSFESKRLWPLRD